MADFSAPFANLQTGQQDPGKFLGLLSSMNQLKDFQSRQAVGQAWQQSGGDPDKFLGLMQANPDAALHAGQATADAAALKGQNIINATNQFGLATGQQKYVADLAASFASKKNFNDQDLATIATLSARAGIPMDMITSTLLGAPGDTRSPQQRFKDFSVWGMGPTGRTDPKTTGYDPTTGQPLLTNAATAERQALGPGNGPAGYATTPPTGFTERTGQSVAQMGALQDAYDSSMTRKGMLGNLENDLQSFTSGPGADWTKVAKSWVNRNVPLPKDWKFDPKSIASQEQFIKQAAQLSQNQFQTLGGTGSNAQFNASYEVNPNDTLSQMGNKGIIGLLKGNEDAIQAKFAAARANEKTNGTASYPDFSLDFNSHYDPRVFQFKYMNDADRKAYFAQMSPEEQQQFASNIEYAHSRKWVTYMTPKK